MILKSNRSAKRTTSKQATDADGNPKFDKDGKPVYVEVSVPYTAHYIGASVVQGEVNVEATFDGYTADNLIDDIQALLSDGNTPEDIARAFNMGSPLYRNKIATTGVTDKAALTPEQREEAMVAMFENRNDEAMKKHLQAFSKSTKVSAQNNVLAQVYEEFCKG